MWITLDCQVRRLIAGEVQDLFFPLEQLISKTVFTLWFEHPEQRCRGRGRGEVGLVVERLGFAAAELIFQLGDWWLRVPGVRRMGPGLDIQAGSRLQADVDMMDVLHVPQQRVCRSQSSVAQGAGEATRL